MNMLIILIVPFMLIMLMTMLAPFSHSDSNMSSPFECGFDSMNHARSPFSSRFFSLALIFLIFDIELALMFPMPLILSSISSHNLNLLLMLFFLIILFLGLIHEWNQNMINWSN